MGRRQDTAKTGELLRVSTPLVSQQSDEDGWHLGFIICRGAGVRQKSQRDFVLQPSVATTKEGLRWVANQKLKSTPTGLWSGRDDPGHNPVGVDIFLIGGSPRVARASQPLG